MGENKVNLDKIHGPILDKNKDGYFILWYDKDINKPYWKKITKEEYEKYRNNG